MAWISQMSDSYLLVAMPSVLAASKLMATILSWIWVALGLGLVIFFHELGHFAVAKWCGVFVERFSIGFGPILWSLKRGDTEYALSAVPFGGYVKMLGQDDMDPSQLSSEEIKQDPRSYSAKPVWQRMAIISAGVIMNIITGTLFFAIAFHDGVETAPARIGSVVVGKAAWAAGLKNGDLVTEVNGKEAHGFMDIMYGVALSSSDVELKGVGADGKQPFQHSLTPDKTDTRRMIGVAPSPDLQLLAMTEDGSSGFPGTVAATVGLQSSDEIISVGGESVRNYAELQRLLISRRADELEFVVKRRPKTEPGQEPATAQEVKVTVPPARFRTLGLSMDIERITAIQKDSPADDAKLRPRDKIIRVDGQDVGATLNPVELPDYFQSRAGQAVEVEIKREVDGGTPKEFKVSITPRDRSGWVDRFEERGSPLSVPSIGVAYQISSVVLKVEPGSPADGQIKPNDRITKIEIYLPQNRIPIGTTILERLANWWSPPKLDVDYFGSRPVELVGSEKQPHIWATAYSVMQMARTRQVKLTVISGDETKTLELQPIEDVKSGLYFPDRGLIHGGEFIIQKATSVGDALRMSARYAKTRGTEVYLTLRSLVRGDLSIKELHGPIGIAKVAHHFASAGLTPLLLFLGFLSINLAVLNFLPIPVLDGGHMVFLCWELVTRKPPSERVLIAAQRFGLIFVVGLMLLVIYLDVFVHTGAGK